MKLVNDEALSYLVVPHSKMLSQYHYSKKELLHILHRTLVLKVIHLGI